MQLLPVGQRFVFATIHVRPPTDVQWDRAPEIRVIGVSLGVDGTVCPFEHLLRFLLGLPTYQTKESGR